MSIKAYQRAATQAESPRELEYRAFGMATASLVRAKDLPASDRAGIAEALDANRRLWNVMSADCSLPSNRLPLALRAQIISLALWVSKYSNEVLRDGADIEALIDVNRSMMEGLAARSG
ncbi:MAG: flagellar biosynthesis regulator FlaF [Terricaulis silvestris]